jgi:thioredoxin reductase (NADPH)
MIFMGAVCRIAWEGQAGYEPCMDAPSALPHPAIEPFEPHVVADVAIVGAGPAGLFMAFEAGFLGFSSVICDALPQAGGQLAALYPDKPIYDVPGCPGILAGQLVANLQRQVAPYRPTYLLGHAVTDLQGDVGDFKLTVGPHTVQAKVVVVAGGSGLFSPRKPAGVMNLAEFEASGAVAYAIPDVSALRGHTVVLAGGGDSAVDWAVALADVATHVHVVHRRRDFKAAEATVAAMQALAAAGKLTIHTPCELAALHGEDGALGMVELVDADGQPTKLPASRLICCFGLAPNPGAVAEWGLGLHKGLIPVNRETLATNRPGVLCVGDMADYAGKVSLIVTGFGEAPAAAKQIQALIAPHKRYKVQYSTSVGLPETGHAG